VAGVEGLTWQPSLLDGRGSEVVPDDRFSTLRRVELDERSWVDHAPSWLAGSDGLFSELVATVDWGRRRRWMYGELVDEPRLTSSWRASAGLPLEPPVLEAMRRLLGRRYGVEFDSMGLNLYRDGRDSVAWHGDRIAKEIEEPIVAIVSLGEARKFLLRPRVGGRSRAFLLGRGDLLVTGGACQRQWEHSVPKVMTAGPRISVTFRHGLDPRTYRS
jgi:alkylated DNA repair dioxygenase AlkB